MNLATAERMIREQSDVAVIRCGGMKVDTKLGTIVALKRKCNEGYTAWYARVRWKKPTKSGEVESDVKINRVQTMAGLLGRPE